MQDRTWLLPHSSSALTHFVITALYAFVVPTQQRTRTSFTRHLPSLQTTFCVRCAACGLPYLPVPPFPFDAPRSLWTSCGLDSSAVLQRLLPLRLRTRTARCTSCHYHLVGVIPSPFPCARHRSSDSFTFMPSPFYTSSYLHQRFMTPITYYPVLLLL